MIVLIVGALYCALLHRRPFRIAFAAALISICAAVDETNSLHAAVVYAIVIVPMVLFVGSCCYAAVKWVARDNIPAYILTVFFYLAVPKTLNLLRETEVFAFWNGVALLALFAAMGVWALAVLSRREASISDTAPALTLEPAMAQEDDSGAK
jgi:hypothetical protein